MKKFLIVGVLILKGVVFANVGDEISEEIKNYLKPEQRVVFEEVFNTNEKLLDSYKIDLSSLKTTDVNYSKKLEFLELKIQELEEFKNLELEKLKNDLLKNPGRYRKGTEKK